MKKLFFLMLVLLLCACSNSNPLNKEAKEQMENTLRSFNKSNEIQINNIKTVFETDSLVVLNCEVREVLKSGLDVPITEEYVYFLGEDGKKRECHVGLFINGVPDGQDLSIFSFARKRAKEFGGNYEQDSVKYLTIAAEEVTTMFGNVVGD